MKISTILLYVSLILLFFLAWYHAGWVWFHPEHWTISAILLVLSLVAYIFEEKEEGE